VSGQLHAPVALPPGKSPRYPFYRRLGWPQNRSGRYGEVKIFCPMGTRTSAPPGRPARSHSKREVKGAYSFLHFEHWNHEYECHSVHGHVCVPCLFGLSCVGEGRSPVKAILSDAYKYDFGTGKSWAALACPVTQEEEHTVNVNFRSYLRTYLCRGRLMEPAGKAELHKCPR
jgi:hypothetical protein